MKLTEEQKQEWLTALKSGKYKQIRNGAILESVTRIKGHCCIMVLAELNGKDDDFITFSHGSILVHGHSGNLIDINDNPVTFPFEKRDYSNVIPYIEGLKCSS